MGGARRAPVLPLVPGLLVALVFAWAAIELAAVPFFRDQLHFGALLLVILLGMTWRALLPVPGWALPGIETAKKPILRWAVAGLGLRLSLGEIAEIGLPALAVVSIGTLVALWAGWWLAKAIGIDHKMGLLLGVGGAICGASAVVAADTVVQGEKKDSALAISVITLLGTIGILLYPQVYAPLFDADTFGYGVWAGASLHETAQVVAAGDAIGTESKEVATVVKLVRICWLAPIVFYLGWSLRRHHEQAGQAKVSLVPWFLVMFLAFAALNSFGLIPQEGALGVDNLKTFGSWLMVVGMAGVGLETSVKDLLRAGPRPVLVGALQWLLLAALTYGLILLFLP
jgi:uncharacterized integral membrane protein (TIGR00698 family)